MQKQGGKLNFIGLACFFRILVVRTTGPAYLHRRWHFGC